MERGNAELAARDTANGRGHVELVFRQARSSGELVELLRLRYAAYRGTVLEGLEPTTPLGFNLDCWDPRATHFGLFARVSGVERPIGYHRLVSDSTKIEEDVLDVVRLHPGLKKALRRPSTPFPMMSISPYRSPLRQAYEDLRKSGRSVVEGSRLSILPGVRSLRTVLCLLHAQTANVALVRGQVAWTICCANHLKFYEALGCRVIERTEPSKVAGVLAVCLRGQAETLPQQLSPALKRMARQLESTGEIVQRARLKIAPSSLVTCA